MSKNYKEINQNLLNYVEKLRIELPDFMQGFGALSITATKPGALEMKHKELIALAISVAVKSEGCIAYHAQSLVRIGVSREELIETLAMAIYMGGGPALMCAAEALKAFEEFSQQK